MKHLATEKCETLKRKNRIYRNRIVSYSKLSQLLHHAYQVNKIQTYAHLLILLLKTFGTRFLQIQHR